MIQIRHLALIVSLVIAAASTNVLADGGKTHGPASMGHGAAGMGGMHSPADIKAQMDAMQQMHARMTAAKTPAERQAMMHEQMQLMHKGMGMMGGMGGRAMMGNQGNQGDMATRQAMMEQRMDMMGSMMQMLVDRSDAEKIIQ